MGFGNIGIKLAQRLRPFGVKIIATKRSWAPYLDKSCKTEGMKPVYENLLADIFL